MLKPSLPFADSTEPSEDASSSVSDICKPFTEKQVKAQGALDALTESLSTPAKERYSTRMKEGYAVEGVSPCFNVYKKLHHKAYPAKEQSHKDSSCGLDLLADAAVNRKNQAEAKPSSAVSSVLLESLKMPKAASEPPKPIRKTMSNILPDNVTSDVSIRTFSLKQLDYMKAFPEKEKKAKEKFLNRKTKDKCSQKGKKGPKSQSSRGKS